MNIFTLSLAILVIFMPTAQAKEMLVQITDIANTQKSFIASIGAKDGVFTGQTALFSNREVSILSRAVEVNRFYSMWIPTTGRRPVVFNRLEMVTYSNDLEQNDKQILKNIQNQN